MIPERPLWKINQQINTTLLAVALTVIAATTIHNGHPPTAALPWAATAITCHTIMRWTRRRAVRLGQTWR